MPIEIRELEVQVTVTPQEPAPMSGSGYLPEQVCQLSMQQLMELIDHIVQSRLLTYHER